jgi:transposase
VPSAPPHPLRQDGTEHHDRYPCHPHHRRRRPHKGVHVAAALDQLGRNLGTASFPVTAAGYQGLLRWLAKFGSLDAVGREPAPIEHGLPATWPNRESSLGGEPPEPPRPTHFGKSDTLDAVRATRPVQAGTALGTPKSADGTVEAIRLLRSPDQEPCRGRTQTPLLIRDIVSTAPEGLRAELTGLTTPKLAAPTARLRPGTSMTPMTSGQARSQSPRSSVALYARRSEYPGRPAGPVVTYAPQLLPLPCVGPNTAGALLVAAGDNPDRLRTESCFAKICGVSPLPARTGRIVRHRHN